MTSKKKLKKRIKKLKKIVDEIQDTNIGTLWFIVNFIKVYDSNMDLIQKTFEKFVEKINSIDDIVNPVSEKEDDIKEEVDKEEE
ncbi:MAG: hypothetical protein GY870_12580 [archaeon]|nr:hypothetical protein [archaeon]